MMDGIPISDWSDDDIIKWHFERFGYPRLPIYYIPFLSYGESLPDTLEVNTVTGKATRIKLDRIKP